MTLFEAKPHDQARETTRRNVIWGSVVLVIILGIFAFVFRHWTYEHTINQFFEQVEKKDFSTAYAIWNADPDWQKHPEKYKDYPFGQFQLDWGPSGEYGNITSHKVAGAVEPRSKGPVTGIVVATRVNDRAKASCLWVDKKTHAISFSPIECSF